MSEEPDSTPSVPESERRPAEGSPGLGAAAAVLGWLAPVVVFAGAIAELKSGTDAAKIVVGAGGGLATLSLVCFVTSGIRFPRSPREPFAGRGWAVSGVVMAVIALFLMGLLLWLTGVRGRNWRQGDCCRTLMQLHEGLKVYRQVCGGGTAYPAAAGSDCWRLLSKEPWKGKVHAQTPSISLICWVAKRSATGDPCDYRGPAAPLSPDTPPDRVIGCDREGTHGPGKWINVLFFDGRVERAEPGSPLYERAILETAE